MQDRLIEVVDSKATGEVLLDEALKLMKASERMSAAQWVDLLSGECSSTPITCFRSNVPRINFTHACKSP